MQVNRRVWLGLTFNESQEISVWIYRYRADTDGSIFETRDIRYFELVKRNVREGRTTKSAQVPRLQ